MRFILQGRKTITNTETKLIFSLLTGLVGTALAQALTPDATALMCTGRVNEVRDLLSRNAQQSPTVQRCFDAGWLKKGLALFPNNKNLARIAEPGESTATQ